MKLFHQTIAIFSALLLFGWASTTTLQAQDETLEDVLEAHFEAVGQDKLAKVKSIHMIGKMSVMGMEIAMEIQQKRPLMYYTKSTIKGMEIINGFDGETAWMQNPMQSAGKAVKMPDEQAKQTLEQADMDGLLHDYEEKGYKLVLVGEEEVEGTETYKLKLTKENGDEIDIFLDMDSYMMIKTKAKMDMMGQEIEAETFFSNYKMIDGVAIPTSIETKAGPQGAMTMEFDEIEFNVEMDDEIFKIPGGVENALEAPKSPAELDREQKIKEIKEKVKEAKAEEGGGNK